MVDRTPLDPKSAPKGKVSVQREEFFFKCQQLLKALNGSIPYKSFQQEYQTFHKESPKLKDYNFENMREALNQCPTVEVRM